VTEVRACTLALAGTARVTQGRGFHLLGGDAERAGRCGQRIRGAAWACGRGGVGAGVRQVLLQILLQRGVGLLRGGEISSLQGLAEGSQVLRDRTAALLRGACCVVMMMVVMRLLCTLLLSAFLDRGEVLLRGGNIACLQVLR
jgi:hypothetical protein